MRAMLYWAREIAHTSPSLRAAGTAQSAAVLSHCARLQRAGDNQMHSSPSLELRRAVCEAIAKQSFWLTLGTEHTTGLALASKTLKKPLNKLVAEALKEYLVELFKAESTYDGLSSALAEYDDMLPQLLAEHRNAEAEAEKRLEKKERTRLRYGNPLIPAELRHRLFDPAHLPKLGRFANKDEPKGQWIEALKESSAARRITLVDDSMRARVATVRETTPNFSEAIAAVERELALCQRGNGQLQLTPMLLVGPPAAGKTYLATELAVALDPASPAEIISMPTVTAAFELSGATQNWSASQPGRILRAFLRTRSASPVFVLDEIEKAMRGNYPAAGVLLPLLERADAARWRDEFYDMSFDVSRSIFIATANDIRSMHPALASRFRIVPVGAPRREEVPAIVRSLYRQLRAEHPALDLDADLDADILRTLAAQFVDARQMQRLLRDALGEAARRPTTAIELTAFDVKRAARGPQA